MSNNIRILAIGLCKHLPGNALGAKVVKMVEEDTAKAVESGFDIVTIYANLQDPKNSVDEIKTALEKDGPWHGFSVGYGMRGDVEQTPLFEEIVNLAKDNDPSTRLMFSPAPNRMFETCLRNFPDHQKR